MYAWQKNVRNVVPYVPGEQPDFPDMIKLNTNENPYPPAPGVQKLLEDADFKKLRLYPAPDNGSIVRALAKYYDREFDEVFVGVGSDDVLANAFLTFFNSQKPILFPDISYSFYEVWADVYKIPYKKVPVREDFSINIDDYFEENGGIVIANPNAPTSLCESVENLEKVIKGNPESVVIIDEAYVDFGAESVLPLTKKYDNLLVVQTFSKSRSMAGMRIGFAIGNKILIKAMNDVKYSINSYTMNRAALTLGVASVEDEEYFKRTTAKLTATRERVKTELEKLGFRVLDSKTNFLFASHRSIPAKELFNVLREKHIFVRYFEKPRISNFLRITIGTDEEMNIFLRFLEVYIDKSSFSK